VCCPLASGCARARPAGVCSTGIAGNMPAPPAARANLADAGRTDRKPGAPHSPTLRRVPHRSAPGPLACMGSPVPERLAAGAHAGKPGARPCRPVAGCQCPQGVRCTRWLPAARFTRPAPCLEEPVCAPPWPTTVSLGVPVVSIQSNRPRRFHRENASAPAMRFPPLEAPRNRTAPVPRPAGWWEAGCPGCRCRVLSRPERFPPACRVSPVCCPGPACGPRTPTLTGWWHRPPRRAVYSVSSIRDGPPNHNIS
jgi:hypothetical protein